MRKRFWWLAIVVAVLLVAGLSASAQESVVEGIEGSFVAEQAAPVIEEAEWLDEVPVLTNEQLIQVAAGTKRANRPGPAIDRGSEATLPTDAAPEASLGLVGQELAPTSEAAPAAPGDPQLYRKTTFGGTIPGGYKSNVMESSTAQNGKFAFFSGNWFGARSTNGGVSWQYRSSFTGFADFCCDQVVLYNPAYDMFLWYRQGVPNASGVNRLLLSVSTNGGSTFCTYQTFPTNTNSGWTNQWWDYPHLQMGADYLYIATNMFNASDNWTRTVMLRWPLDKLATCTGFNYSYTSTNTWFTWVPVQNADHVMYFASNYPTSSPYNRVRIWTWREDSSSVNTSTTLTVPVWNYTGRGQAVCGSSTNNWAARLDDRMLTGARYMLHTNNVRIPGRTVLGWWWNVKAGLGFSQPYANGVAVYENTMGLLSGAQGRPFMRDNNTCILYPSVAANGRGDLGVVFNVGAGSNKVPAVAYMMQDDYAPAIPGGTYYTIQTSGARPSDRRWGDYNTVRPMSPVQTNWVAAAHYIPGSSACSACSAPVFFNFGRARDARAWNYWQNK